MRIDRLIANALLLVRTSYCYFYTSSLEHTLISLGWRIVFRGDYFLGAQ